MTPSPSLATVQQALQAHSSFTLLRRTHQYRQHGSTAHAGDRPSFVAVVVVVTSP